MRATKTKQHRSLAPLGKDPIVSNKFYQGGSVPPWKTLFRADRLASQVNSFPKRCLLWTQKRMDVATYDASHKTAMRIDGRTINAV